MNEHTDSDGQPPKRRGGGSGISDQALLERMLALGRRMRTMGRPSPESLLSDSEHMVLAALSGGREMMTMKQLSERSGIPPSLISRLVKGLEERKAYVERLPSKEDRRHVYIRITEEGERTLRTYVKRRMERLRTVVRELDDEERKVVWRSIEIFEAILERSRA
jgi:DNA-binding MarR family transcriptional regulator